MKRMHDSTRLVEIFVKTGLIAAITAAMLMPATINANGAEAAAHKQHHAVLPLPPIPDLKAIPWLSLDRAPKGPRIDTLLTPLPSTQFATDAGSRLPIWPDPILAEATLPSRG